MLSHLRDSFNRGLTRPLSYRQQQLAGLDTFLREREGEIEQALFHDLGKPAMEAFATEINILQREVKLMRKQLSAWVKPKRVPTTLFLQPGRSMIYSEPYGVVLIISPWNYPIQLALAPLMGAIAAGNCVVLKPSEIAPATSRLLAEALPHYLDPASISVVEGGVTETAALLEQEFDYIFYTGGSSVGRLVMTAAAKHLTPVTLELGGKSPCIVDQTANLTVAARRIIWGKFTNAGQTCIAPDYLLVQEDIKEALLHEMRVALDTFYGSNPMTSPDYGRIINLNHFRRLAGLLQGGGKIVVGGETNEQQRYIAPTILDEVSPNSPVMANEIFGPILPVITVKNSNEAIQFINKRPKPLALYLFSTDKALQQQILAQTSSGSVCLNHVVMQVAVPALPFGGVGQSGMGAYHGKASFDTFSHQKSVLSKPSWFDPSFMYPPYKPLLKKLLRWL